MDALVFTGGVDRNDVRMVQPGGGLGLAAEALHGFFGQPQSGAEQLERNLAVEGDLPRFMDAAHAAAADLAHDLEIADPLRRYGWGFIDGRGT